MTVKLVCDLCKREITLEPGDNSDYFASKPNYGWAWCRPSSFDLQLIILQETLCDKCNQNIKIAIHNAEMAERERLSASK